MGLVPVSVPSWRSSWGLFFGNINWGIQQVHVSALYSGVQHWGKKARNFLILWKGLIGKPWTDMGKMSAVGTSVISVSKLIWRVCFHAVSWRGCFMLSKNCQYFLMFFRQITFNNIKAIVNFVLGLIISWSLFEMLLHEYVGTVFNFTMSWGWWRKGPMVNLQRGIFTIDRWINS